MNGGADILVCPKRTFRTTFLYPAVKNLAIGHRRKTARFAGDQPLDALPAAAAHPAQPSELAALVAKLPEGQQEVVLMRFVDGFSLEEIATALAIPTGTVKSRLHNALATLRADPVVQKFFEPP